MTHHRVGAGVDEPLGQESRSPCIVPSNRLSLGHVAFNATGRRAECVGRGQRVITTV
jgi:hypothetical protein